MEKAEEYPNCLPICSSCNDINFLGCEDYCELSSTKIFDKTNILILKGIGLGFAWNKIFDRCIIEKYHLRFRTWKEKNDFNEDIVFFMQYIEYKKGFIFTGYSDYYYRIINDSLSRGNKQPKLDRHIEKYNLWKDFNIKYCNSSDDIYDDISNDLLYQVILYLKSETSKSIIPTKAFIKIVKCELISELLNNIKNQKESNKITYLLRKKCFLLLWILLKIKK